MGRREGGEKGGEKGGERGHDGREEEREEEEGGRGRKRRESAGSGLPVNMALSRGMLIKKE